MSMYNRLFTKILDSSIWLEPLHVRVVWITFLAAMDEDGFAAFACPENLARRAGVSQEEAFNALEILMSPDKRSPGQEHDGRRIAKIEGGYLVLNAVKYRNLFNREVQREQTRLRVAKLRSKSDSVTHVTKCNENVTLPHEYECTSATASEVKEEKCEEKPEPGSHAVAPVTECNASITEHNGHALCEITVAQQAEQVYEAYPRKVAKAYSLRCIAKALRKHGFDYLLERTQAYAAARNGEDQTFTPYPSTWFNQERFKDDPSTWSAEKPESNGHTDAQNILHQKELDRIEVAIKRLLDCASHTAMGVILSDDEKKRLRELKTRKKELIAELGMIA